MTYGLIASNLVNQARSDQAVMATLCDFLVNLLRLTPATNPDPSANPGPATDPATDQDPAKTVQEEPKGKEKEVPSLSAAPISTSSLSISVG